MKTTLALFAAAALSACASAPMTRPVDNASLPEAVRAPAGQRALMTTAATGELTYECRAAKDAADRHEWVFVGPVATLFGPDRKVVGKYYGGPTWESTDGSKVTGKQVAVAPGMSGSIPLQLVKADPATGSGAMSKVNYIQRINTRGGVAPALPCTAAQVGQRQQVTYAADYVFYGS